MTGRYVSLPGGEGQKRLLPRVNAYWDETPMRFKLKFEACGAWCGSIRIVGMEKNLDLLDFSVEKNAEMW